jgi:hypothetical protein
VLSIVSPRTDHQTAAQSYNLQPCAATVATGKGRGLVATQQLQPGQLLLVTPPLALVKGDLGEIPDHNELQEVMASSGAKFTSWQAAWLKALVCNTEQDVSSSSSDLAVPDMLPPAGYSSWYGEPAAGSTAAAAAAGSGAAEDRVPFEELGMSDERLLAAIGECAYKRTTFVRTAGIGKVWIASLHWCSEQGTLHLNGVCSCTTDV